MRELTEDGDELAVFFHRVFTGEPLEGLDFPTLKDRMTAAGWLADRGFGKATETVTFGARDVQETQIKEAAASFTAELAKLAAR